MDKAHALVDPYGHFVVWWNPRCGCTSAKKWYLESLGFNVHKLADGTLGVPYFNLSLHNTVNLLARELPPPAEPTCPELAIARNPLARLVSHFQSSGTECWPINIEEPAYGNMAAPIDVYRNFREFIELICDTPAEHLEHHVAPQVSTWHPRKLPRILKLEKIRREWPVQMARLRMPPRAFPEANRRVLDKTIRANVSEVSLEELHARRLYPTWEWYYTSNLRRLIRLKYAEDFRELDY